MKVFIDGDDPGSNPTNQPGPGSYTEADVNRAAEHLQRLDHSEANDEILQRIRKAIQKGEALSEGQENFMRKELTEAGLMDKGMSYEDAHEKALATMIPM